jgi:hypothetical protein
MTEMVRMGARASLAEDQRPCDLLLVPTVIELFEVPPDADAAFLAEWRRERAGATLYRALRDDVPFRFVSLTPEAGAGYELAHEDGTPDVAGGVTQIVPFADDELLPAWQQLREATSAQRGYLGSRLYRRDAPTDFRYIAMTRWSSPLMVARAAREIDTTLPLPFHSALYLLAE